MNSLDYSLRDIEVMQYIKRHPNCSVQKLKLKYGSAFVTTAYDLHHNELIHLDEQTQQFSLLGPGEEVLRDYALQRRSKFTSAVINGSVAIISAIAGGIAGTITGAIVSYWINFI